MPEQRVIQQRVTFTRDHLGGVDVDHGTCRRFDGVSIGGDEAVHGRLTDGARRVDGSLPDFNDGGSRFNPFGFQQHDEKGGYNAYGGGLQEKRNGITYVHGVLNLSINTGIIAKAAVEGELSVPVGVT